MTRWTSFLYSADGTGQGELEEQAGRDEKAPATENSGGIETSSLNEAEQVDLERGTDDGEGNGTDDDTGRSGNGCRRYACSGGNEGRSRSRNIRDEPKTQEDWDETGPRPAHSP